MCETPARHVRNRRETPARQLGVIYQWSTNGLQVIPKCSDNERKMNKEYLKNGLFKFQDCAIFLKVGMNNGINGTSYDLLQNKNCVNVNLLKINYDTVY